MRTMGAFPGFQGALNTYAHVWPPATSRRGNRSLPPPSPGASRALYGDVWPSLNAGNVTKLILGNQFQVAARSQSRKSAAAARLASSWRLTRSPTEADILCYSAKGNSLSFLTDFWQKI